MNTQLKEFQVAVVQNLRPRDTEASGPCYGPQGARASENNVLEFIRLPKSGTRDPIFSLTRSHLNSLILPTAENNFKPPVASICLRRRGAVKGVRLINVDSLRSYIYGQSETTPGNGNTPPP